MDDARVLCVPGAPECHAQCGVWGFATAALRAESAPNVAVSRGPSWRCYRFFSVGAATEPAYNPEWEPYRRNILRGWSILAVLAAESCDNANWTARGFRGGTREFVSTR